MAVVRSALNLLVRLGVAVLAVTALLTALIRLVPGDPAAILLGIKASPEAIAAIHKKMGLDAPYFQNLLEVWRRLLAGDMGSSLVNGQPVTAIVFPALEITLSLVALTILISVTFGLAAGLLISGRTRAAGRSLVSALVTVGLAIPPVVAGMVLILVVALGAGFAPAGGWPGEWPDNLGYVWLPSVALALGLVPYVIRAVVQAADGVNRSTFVDAAVTRGIAPIGITIRHVLPNSLVTLITLIGYTVTTLLGGAVVVEAVFGIPGLGGVLLSAVASRDIPVITGVAVCVTVAAVLANGLSEVITSVIDPRVRRTGHS